MAAETKIIFIGVDNERASPEIRGLYTGQEISVRFCSSRTGKLYISEITCMTGFRIWTVITKRSNVPMATGTGTAFTTEITGIMNMESVFAWRELRKSRNDFYSSSYVKSNGFTDDIGSRKHSNGHSKYEQRIESCVHIIYFDLVLWFSGFF